jgi:hypothetical protein
MFSFKSLAIPMVGIFILFAFSTFPFVISNAQDTVNVFANYTTFWRNPIPEELFGLVNSPQMMPYPGQTGYNYYTALAETTGVKYIWVELPYDGHRYNWLTGWQKMAATDSTLGWTIAHWKQYSEDTGIKYIGVISPRLYTTRGGNDQDGRPPGGLNPGAVVQWCIDNNWDPKYWKYWKIGGETYGDWDREYFANVDSFIAVCREIIVNMKSVAPNIKIGVPIDAIWKPGMEWTAKIIQEIGDSIDFVDEHFYPHDGWTNPFGTMQHYPWLKKELRSVMRDIYNTYNNGNWIPIMIGEYDFWGMDAYGAEYVRRNTTLADAIAWCDNWGTMIKDSIDIATGYDMVGWASYAFLLWWGELQYLPKKYRPQAYAMELWTKYFGQKMVATSVSNVGKYILLDDGREAWANVRCCSWDSPPYTTYWPDTVTYVTAYAGIDTINSKATLFVVNKDTSQYVVNVNLSNITLSGASSDIYTFTCTDCSHGLLSANRQWDDTPPEIVRATKNTQALSTSFNYTIPKYSMVSFVLPIEEGEPPSDTIAPAAVTNLATSNPTPNSITLSWTAPGDDGNSGTASQYDIRYSTSNITPSNWSSATQASGEPVPQTAGTSQSMTVSSLNSSTAYYFAMKTADEVPNWSGLSNVASGTTQQPGNQPPQIDSIQCQKSGNWVGCSQIHYGETITRVRANVTDTDGTISSVRFRLLNLPDSQEFFNNIGTNAGSGWYIYDNSDLLIQNSGDFRLTVTATDDDTAQSSADSTWLVPWGTLSASLINPAQNCSVYQNQAFIFQARLTCQGGECGDIQATLDPLLSLNRLTYASSVEVPGFEPGYAVDGSMSTRWSSNYTDNEWLYVDLEDIYSVEQVVIYWEDAYGQEYKIQVSEDALSWTEVVHITNGDGGRDDLSFEPVRARYVRMLGIHRGTEWGYSIWEFEVYGEEITSNTKGAISTTVGATPFYTTSGNPQTQANMRAGDVFNQTWQVIPTGGIGESYEFFVINHPATYSTYINDAESPHINITIIQPNVPAPPQAIDDLMATISGDSVLLTWSAVTTDTSGEEITIHHYVIYRGTEVYFDPTPSDSIGYTDSNTSNFVDPGVGGVNVVGNVDTNYYYVVKAVDVYGSYSDISNRVGEYDYEIVVTPTTDFSYVTLPFTGTGITDADGLISSIGASKINNVNRFIPSSQSYEARFAAGYGTNFSVVSGGIYQVNAKSYTIWSIAGAIPPAGSISYSVITTPTTDFNFISIPFEDEDIYQTAQDVIDSLPGVLNTLNNFIPSSQSWESRFAAGYGPNFGVKPGGVYQANAKASATFPPGE